METVLITGCSTGIGRCLARVLHQSGYQVWATARQPETLDELEAMGIRTACLDITRHEQLTNVIRRMVSEHGTIDVLINNAGYGGMGPLSEMPLTELFQQFDINVLSQLALSHAVIPFMQKQSRGAIINIGSVAGEVAIPFSGAYCASKAAFNALSDTLRMELKPFGINVLTVMPGAIHSDFAKNANKALDRVLLDDSSYSAIERSIRDRANASQKYPTPTEKVAVAIRKWLQSNQKKGILRIGHGAKLLPMVKRVIPTLWFEAFLSRKFQLNTLKPSSHRTDTRL